MLAPQLQQMSQTAADMEAKLSRQGELIDAALDMYTEVFEWAANTAHSECSQAVLDIIDKHLSKFNTGAPVASGVASPID